MGRLREEPAGQGRSVFKLHGSLGTLWPVPLVAWVTIFPQGPSIFPPELLVVAVRSCHEEELEQS